MKLIGTILSVAFCFSLVLTTNLLSPAAAQTAPTQSKQATGAESSSLATQDDSKTGTSGKTNTATINSEPTAQTDPTNPTETTAAANNAPKKTIELTFDDLKFEMEKGGKFERSLLTDEINSYNNNVIKVRGYIRPSFSQSGLTKFIFVRDNKECCFGPGAALYDCILVRLAKGSTTDFTVRPVTIQGTFTLKEYQGPDGKVWSIYRMNDTEVK